MARMNADLKASGGQSGDVLIPVGYPRLVSAYTESREIGY